MITPLEEPIPDTNLLRARAFTRALAFGATEDIWGTEFRVNETQSGRSWLAMQGAQENFQALMKKWQGEIPARSLFVTLGYLVLQRDERGSDYYRLTQRAFELLDEATPSSIFISYKRDESSAFALLLLTRMKTVGLDPFLDMQIRPGDEWHARLEVEVRQRENFVCLLGPSSLVSEYVRAEIAWALDQGNQIIPVWHNGFGEDDLNAACKDHPKIARLKTVQAIPVQQENIAGYNSAILRSSQSFRLHTLTLTRPRSQEQNHHAQAHRQ